MLISVEDVLCLEECFNVVRFKLDFFGHHVIALLDKFRSRCAHFEIFLWFVDM